MKVDKSVLNGKLGARAASTALLSLILGLAACTSTVQAPAEDIELQAASNLTRDVAAGSDDAEEAEDGAVYLTSPDLDMVYDSGTSDRGKQTLGIRFTNISVPKGATITKATIQFTADETSSMRTKISLRAMAQDNPGTFTTSSSLTGASKTSERILWEIEPWSVVGERGTKQKTPNFANVVQEVVNRSGWKSGNAVAFVIEGAEGSRAAEAYEGSVSSAPRLYIEYSTGNTTPPSTPQADYYVATNGSNSNSGTSDKPFATLQKALDAVKAGQTVYIKNGTYKSSTQAVTKTSGSSSAGRITIRGESTGGTILDGSNTNFSSCGHTGVLRLDHDRYVVENLTVTNSSCVGIQLEDSDYTVVRNIVSHHNGEDGIYAKSSDNLVVENVRSYNNIKPGSGTSGDGIKVGNSNNVKISDCRVHNNHDDGVDVWDSLNVTVNRCVSYSNGLSGGDGNGFKMGAPYLNSDQATVFRPEMKNNGNTFINSVAFGNKRYNFDSNSAGGITVCKSSSWNGANRGFVSYSSGRAKGVDKNTFRSNISFGESLTFAGQDTVDNNAFQTRTSDLALDGDPYVSTNPDSPDFLKLKSGYSYLQGVGANLNSTSSSCS